MGLSNRNIKNGLKKKIEKCILLLGEEYTSLKFTIYYYPNKEKLQNEQFNKPDMKEENYRQILYGYNEISGITIGEQGKIKIFLFMYKNIEKDPEEIILLIANLYHEIRHAWQYENKLFLGENEVLTIDDNKELYYSLPSEKDAYKFQEKEMQKYSKKILGIFGIHDIYFEYRLKKEIRDIVFLK